MPAPSLCPRPSKTYALRRAGETKTPAKQCERAMNACATKPRMLLNERGGTRSSTHTLRKQSTEYFPGGTPHEKLSSPYARLWGAEESRPVPGVVQRTREPVEQDVFPRVERQVLL